MEKNVGFSATTAQSSVPLPTAPPSYEEAIANAGGASMQPSGVPTPYPLGNASIQMPMPCTCPDNKADLTLFDNIKLKLN